MAAAAAAARVLALACASLAIVGKADDSGGSGRGYSLSFQGNLAVAGIKTSPFNFSDPVWDGFSRNVTYAAWILFHPTAPYPGTPYRWRSQSNNYLLDLQWGGTWNTAAGWLYPWTSEPHQKRETNVWQHITQVFMGDELSIYLNGELTGKDRVPNYSIKQPGATMYLGGLLYSGAWVTSTIRSNLNAAFRGEIDEIQLWSKAMDAAEITHIMNTQLDLSSAPAPDDLVLYYNFDAGGCDPDQAAQGLEHESCALSGDFIAPNLGSTGRDYDLLLGQLNNDYGFGLEYVDKNTPDAPPIRFDMPILAASTVPIPTGHTPTAFTASAPRIYTASAGDKVVVAIPAGGTTTVAVAPGIGKLRRASDGSELVAGASVGAETSVVFHAPPEPSEGDDPWCTTAWFSLEEGGVVQEIHVRPRLAPRLSNIVTMRDDGSGSASFETSEGESAVVKLGPFCVSPMGKLPDVVVRAPTRNGTVTLTRFHGSEPLPDGALQAGAIVPSSLGLAIRYTPDQYFFGTDELVVQCVSPETGLASPLLSLAIRVKPFNNKPIIEGSALTVPEDALQNEAPWITLNATDPEGDFGLTLGILELPTKGDLFMEDGPGGPERRIETPYNIYDVGKVITEQYVDDVVALSTHGGGPYGLLGPPTCASFARLGESGNTCEDHRLEDPAFEPYVGMLVDVDRYHGQNTTLTYTVEGLITNITTVRINSEQTLLYDVLVPHFWRYVPDDVERPENLVRCTMTDPGTFKEGFPSDCSTEEAAKLPDEGLLLRGLTRDDMQGATRVFQFSDPNLSSSVRRISPYRARFGPRYWYEYEPWVSYEAEGYTEFVEVAFREAVFPISVEVGSPRGGGSTVSIKAKDPGGNWQRMYRGKALREKSKDNTGFYFFFQEPICRPAFRTKVLRLEFDTSSATGIADWNYFDYIKLIGSPDNQPAMLRHGASRVRYVPQADQFGEDSFTFQAYDCGGARLRGALADAVTTVTISASNDAPTLSSDTAAPISLCGVAGSEEIDLAFTAVDLDGDEIEISVQSLPTLGTLSSLSVDGEASPIVSSETALTNLDTLDPADVDGITVPQATVRRTVLRYAPPCDALTASTDVSVTLRVADASGAASTLVVEIAVLQEDKGLIADGTLAMSKAMFAVNMAFSGLMLGWVLVNRWHPIVKASQVPFQIMLLVGCVISSMTILFINTDDRYGSAWADTACTLQVWLYCFGSLGSISPLTVKLMRVRYIFDEDFNRKMALGTKQERAMAQRMVSVKWLTVLIGVMVGIDVVMLTVWTMSEPLRYVREPITIDRASGYTTASMAKCSSENAVTFVAVVFAYHLIILLYLSFMAYKSSHINTAFSEAKYVRIVVFSMLQVMLMSVPIMVIASDNATTIAFTRSAVVFLNDFTAVALIFVPKVLMQLFPSIMVDSSGTGAEHIQNSVARSRASSKMSKVLSSGAVPGSGKASKPPSNAGSGASGSSKTYAKVSPDPGS